MVSEKRIFHFHFIKYALNYDDGIFTISVEYRGKREEISVFDTEENAMGIYNLALYGKALPGTLRYIAEDYAVARAK